MRKYLFVLTLALALVVGGWSANPAHAVSCGSTTSTPALGLKKVGGARGWWQCIDDSFDLLDTALGVEMVSSTATAGAATTLTDSTQDWETNLWANDVVKITGGTGSGQSRSIASNTATVLTVSAAWTTNPDATSTYKVLAGAGAFLPTSGGTMTGKITLDADPSSALHAATKQYVDAVGAPAGIAFVIDGVGSVITTGEKGHLEVPFQCTINRVTTLADQSGSIVVDIWKDTYANFPPTDADSITASAPPTLSGAVKAQDSTLTGWTTSVAAGDILAWNVDSATTVERVLVSLKCTKN